MVDINNMKIVPKVRVPVRRRLMFKMLYWLQFVKFIDGLPFALAEANNIFCFSNGYLKLKICNGTDVLMRSHADKKHIFFSVLIYNTYITKIKGECQAIRNGEQNVAYAFTICGWKQCFSETQHDIFVLNITWPG